MHPGVLQNSRKVITNDPLVQVAINANTPEFSLKEEKGLNNPEFQLNKTRLAERFTTINSLERESVNPPPGPVFTSLSGKRSPKTV